MTEIIHIDEKLTDRYQNQPWYIKCLRNLHYWSVPFVAARCWYYEQHRELEDEDDWRFDFRAAWRIATGLAQSKMKYYYTWEEVVGKLDLDLDDADTEENKNE